MQMQMQMQMEMQWMDGWMICFALS